jgi:FkbM family methyltransferase
MKRLRLPDGRRIWHLPGSRGEALFIHREIFEHRSYVRGGVALHEGDVVVDAGANIGLFTLWAMAETKRLRILCVEPVPPTRACLERNLAESPERGGHEVEVVGCALGATEGETTITFLPTTPGNSTLHPAAKREEVDRLAAEFRLRDVWQWTRPAALALAAVYPFRRALLRRALRSAFAHALEFPCVLRRLETLADEQGLDRIDLLKVDVEGAELELLEGIGEARWRSVRQLAMEVAPANKGRLTALCDVLRARGFTRVTLEGLAGGEFVLGDAFTCMLYAVR